MFPPTRGVVKVSQAGGVREFHPENALVWIAPPDDYDKVGASADEVGGGEDSGISGSSDSAGSTGARGKG